MSIQLMSAAKCLAMLRSRNAVKSELRAYGHKVSDLSAREITSWASVWLDDHAAELIPASIEQAQRMILSGAWQARTASPGASAMCKSFK